MAQRTSKLIQLVNQFYDLVQVSLMIWFRLLKSGIVYGWLDGLYCGYVNSTRDSQTLRFRDRLKVSLQLKYQRVVSLSVSFLLAGGVFLDWYRVRFNLAGNLLLIVLGLLVQLGVVYLIWLAYLSATEEQQPLLYAKALDLMLRRFPVSLSLWFLLIGGLLLAYANLVIFVLVVPGAFCKLSTKLLASRSSQRQLIN